MTIVAIIVMAAPLMVFEMIPRSDNETLPLSMTITAPIAAGIASLIPLGLQRINPRVTKKVMIVTQTVKCVIFFSFHLTSNSGCFPETTLPPRFGDSANVPPFHLSLYDVVHYLYVTR